MWISFFLAAHRAVWLRPQSGANDSRSAGACCRQAFGITGGQEPVTVKLLVEPKLAVYISERQWHPSRVLKRRRDGRVELRMEPE